ncbi:predicted protein [Sclerotinia sclerotiorum 1980 UF-70]|uniref:Uncharacterized protein n=1 Tax=Sclerotinia sclerotiorum (strain ATCC 18683 / 1980 / Ss-1) TaxID=665079 RepID=A7ESZ0_SCLS1|nr:predicted protein [Sclerotinia sclerotiorum 1980 UF-70]EDN92582.1 predicted protein [Sclerotinia sclerotiorum 1980 UF-70]
MDTFEDMANLAEGFQVKTTIKSTGEPRHFGEKYGPHWEKKTKQLPTSNAFARKTLRFPCHHLPPFACQESSNHTTITSCKFDNHYFEKNGAMKAMIFIGFIYQDLDEFIIQDSDCKFPHKLDLPENRELWTKWILWIFKVQSAHEEYAFMRAGSAFKVSKVVIRPGVKIARPFEDCSEGQKYAQSMVRAVKKSKHYIKYIYIDPPQ